MKISRLASDRSAPRLADAHFTVRCPDGAHATGGRRGTAIRCTSRRWARTTGRGREGSAGGTAGRGAASWATTASGGGATPIGPGPAPRCRLSRSSPSPSPSFAPSFARLLSLALPAVRRREER
eukprot:527822-Rhodomonas_salina.3